MTNHTVDFIQHRALPESWTRAARRIQGVRVLTVPDRASRHWAERPARIWAFGWRDCQPVFRDILSRATQHGVRAVAIGDPEWQEQASILGQGGWVLPEPPRLEELLSWLVRTGGSPNGSAPVRKRTLAAPTLLVHGTLRYVLIDGQEVPLPPRELALLDLLSRGGEACLSTSALSHALLEGSAANQRRVLAQHLHSLRRKLGRFGAHIEFTKTDGYRTWLQLQWLHIAPPVRELVCPHASH